MNNSNEKNEDETFNPKSHFKTEKKYENTQVLIEVKNYKGNSEKRKENKNRDKYQTSASQKSTGHHNI